MVTGALVCLRVFDDLIPFFFDRLYEQIAAGLIGNVVHNGGANGYLGHLAPYCRTRPR